MGLSVSSGGKAHGMHEDGLGSILKTSYGLRTSRNTRISLEVGGRKERLANKDLPAAARDTGSIPQY